ncbi:MAG: CsbD family protein [Mycobacterium sp.]
MANYVSGPVLFVKGIVEDALGKAKELLGTVLGRSDISREGQAQQDKADAQRNAGKKESEANSARAAAKAAEQRQRARQ